LFDQKVKLAKFVAAKRFRSALRLVNEMQVMVTRLGAAQGSAPKSETFSDLAGTEDQQTVQPAALKMRYEQKWESLLPSLEAAQQSEPANREAKALQKEMRHQKVKFAKLVADNRLQAALEAVGEMEKTLAQFKAAQGESESDDEKDRGRPVTEGEK